MLRKPGAMHSRVLTKGEAIHFVQAPLAICRHAAVVAMAEWRVVKTVVANRFKEVRAHSASTQPPAVASQPQTPSVKQTTLLDGSFPGKAKGDINVAHRGKTDALWTSNILATGFTHLHFFYDAEKKKNTRKGRNRNWPASLVFPVNVLKGFRQYRTL